MATVTYELRLRNWKTIETKEFENQNAAVNYAHNTALAWVTSDGNRGFTFMVGTVYDNPNALVYSVWDRDNRCIARYTAKWG